MGLPTVCVLRTQGINTAIPSLPPLRQTLEYVRKSSNDLILAYENLAVVTLNNTIMGLLVRSP